MTIMLAYVGPGAGLGFLGSLLAVVAVVALGFLGLVFYPLKLVMSWLARSQAPLGNAACRTSASTSGRPAN